MRGHDRDTRRLGTILGVWAHPDDEIYLSGGIMARAAKHGARVACAMATRGEQGSQDERRWKPSEIAGVRTRELEDALAVIGVQELYWLGYVDGRCPGVPVEEGAARVASVIEKVRPDSILTFGEEGLTGHADHIAVSRWTTAAFHAGAKAGARLYYATTTPEWNERFYAELNRYDVFASGTPPSIPRAQLGIYVELQGEDLDLKLQALGKHVSQTAFLEHSIGPRLWRESNAEEMFVCGAEKGIGDGF